MAPAAIDADTGPHRASASDTESGQVRLLERCLFLKEHMINFIELRDSGKILLVACGYDGHGTFEVEASRLIQLEDGTILVPPTACPMCAPVKLNLIRRVNIEPEIKLEAPKGFVPLPK